MRTAISSPGRPGTRGFSLLEVLVVLILFGLVAALIMPSFSGGFKSLELEAAARDMVTRMKQSRSEAVARQSVFRILLNSGQEKSVYVLTDAYDKEIRSFNLPEGVSFEFPEGEADGTRRISFYPNGRSSGAEFALKSDRGKRVHIEVDPVTGFGRVRPREGEENVP